MNRLTIENPKKPARFYFFFVTADEWSLAYTNKKTVQAGQLAKKNSEPSF
ncbi:hypothetical protein C4J88_2169 [Pseudomonas sp. R4-39-08]|nr:hypothetical protein C4J88_2169 [Pseudomonas sp. R4-39-08]